ncbi:Sec14p-like phosphatidylinositol transfer family protein [Striga asiatica]|uniref:Sec14p-like phosphatidylinositol transfer family protein n=1 Tax=Striga asiatica TaxID=4170 RepID=A0A5A7PSJ8_STRAF|nr:Sec14p-like phosphatidylinositol transfer family protein [Striga asiatica]
MDAVDMVFVGSNGVLESGVMSMFGERLQDENEPMYVVDGHQSLYLLERGKNKLMDGRVVFPGSLLHAIPHSAQRISGLSGMVMKPLLHERKRARRKIDVLSGCGHDNGLLSPIPAVRDPLDLRIVYIVFSFHLPTNFCLETVELEIRNHKSQGSVHVTLPLNADEDDIVTTLESTLEKFKNVERCQESVGCLRINENNS